MKRLIAVLPLVLLASACGSSGGGAPTTVTRTITRTVTAAASPSAAGGASDAGADPAAAGSSSASAGAVPDACSVLTQSEAEKVAGTGLMKPVGAGTNSSGADVECQYTGPTTGPTAQVEIYIGDGAKQQLHIERDNLKHTFTTVPGIGDQCVQEDDWIFVQKNGLWASIHLVRLDDPKLHVSALQTAAKELVTHLP